MRVLTDSDVRKAPPVSVVAAAREALARYSRGELVAPPRIRAGAGAVDYVFTVGGLAGGASGFRVYRTGDVAGDQLVAVWDENGTLTGVAVGNELGTRRTGALGAVAADALARPDARQVAVVGSGHQAWAQLWALTAVRSPAQVRVYSPSPGHSEAFAGRARDELRLPATAVGTAAAAARGADIILAATSSGSPVIAPHDVSPGAHITTVGPKFRGRHELPAELAGAASVIACDSPAQARSYPEPFFTDPAAFVSLGDIVTGRCPGRQNDGDLTLYCSVGLAGSEIVLAQRLLRESG